MDDDSNKTKFLLDIVDKAIQIRHDSYKKALKYQDTEDLSKSKDAQRDMMKSARLTQELFELVDQFELMNGKVPIHQQDL